MILTKELAIFDWCIERIAIARKYEEAGKLNKIKIYNTFYSQPNGAYIQFRFEIEGNFVVKLFEYDDNGNPVSVESIEKNLFDKNYKSRDYHNISFEYSDEVIKGNYNWVIALVNRSFDDRVLLDFELEDYISKETWRDLAIQKDSFLYKKKE